MKLKVIQLCSIVYLRVPYVARFLLCTPTRYVKTLIYELCYKYTAVEDNFMWSYMLSVLPLSYKLITNVLFV